MIINNSFRLNGSFFLVVNELMRILYRGFYAKGVNCVLMVNVYFLNIENSAEQRRR